MTDSPKPPRKTKTEREAERQAKLKAEIDKPIYPIIWILLGGVLLLITLFAKKLWLIRKYLLN